MPICLERAGNCQAVLSAAATARSSFAEATLSGKRRKMVTLPTAASPSSQRQVPDTQKLLEELALYNFDFANDKRDRYKADILSGLQTH